MKIVIYVNYSSIEFNKDFQLSNTLISSGHNVFLAINDIQYNELKKNCDKAVLGYSVISSVIDDEAISLDISKDIDCNIQNIIS